MDDLSPDENTVLIRRKATPISIHFEAAGNGYYILELHANRGKVRPFILNLIGTTEEITSSVDIRWFIKPNRKTETVVIRLYLIEETKFGKTSIKTLLKEYRRKYNNQRKLNKD
ncbi:hypothetical protein [Chitinophaga sancti]|uniref:hypothetical protein n=1 Tax=Chitinophaga sancti TaxID=1004 RepID=UPI000930D357|nr:hypothetical protein [Chitinophaga sancti]WQD63974.1 hypothetical protein U0033_06160 [Chitinophaga sancti]